MTCSSLFATGKKLFTRAKPIAIPLAVFLGCMLCACFVWYQYLTNLGNASQRFLMNDAYTTTTAPMQEGETLTQEFSTFLPVYEIGVYFERLSDTVAGSLSVQLQEVGSDAMLLDTTGNIASVYYDSYTSFSLPQPQTQYGEMKTYRISITPYYTSDAGQLTLKKSDTVAENFLSLTENGANAEGSLAMLLTYNKLGNGPTLYYFILCAFFALCAAVLCWLCFFAKGKFALSKPLLAFVGILVVGLFYQFALPAYSTPDEQLHYDTAYSISNQWLGHTPEAEGATLSKRETDAQKEYADYYTTAFTYRYIAENFFTTPDQTVYHDESPVLVGEYALPYYISAAGLSLGQLFGWAGIFTTFFARCLNLIFFAGMVACAVWLAPFGKNIFVAVALLPISLHVGGSFSYDSCLLSLSFVLLALGLRLAYQEGLVRWREVAVFALLCFLIAPLKIAYFPLAGIALFIPAARFAKRWQSYLVRFGVPCLGVLHFLALHYIALVVQVKVSIDLDAVAAETAAQALPDNFVTGYTISTLFTHPGVVLRLVSNTFFTNFKDYFLSLFGGSLGYQSLSEVNLNVLFPLAFVLLACVAMLPEQDEQSPRIWHRILLSGMAVCVLGILVVACFSWTPVTHATLWGFQGRYLLPVLGFALFAMRPTGLVTTRNALPAILYGGVLLNFLALLNVAAIILCR